MEEIKDDDNIESYLYAYMLIRGDLIDPEKISNELDITPTKTFRKGEIWGNNKQKIRKFSLWEICTVDNVDSDNLADHLVWILEKIEDKKDVLIRLSTKENAHIELTIVFSMFGIDYGGEISPELLHRIADLNLTLGLSMYDLGNVNKYLYGERPYS